MLFKIFAVIISAILGMGGSVPAAAPLNADSVLRERGYPELVLEYMDERGKSELAEKSGYRFSDAKLVWYDGGRVTVCDDAEQLPERPGVVVLWLASVRTLPNGTPESVFVQMSYEWTPLPLFRGRDSVIAEWDTSALKIKDGSFYKIDSYDGTLLDENGKVVTAYSDVTREESTEYETTAGGAAWMARLGGFTGLVMTGLRGYARLTLTPTGAETGSMTIDCGYRHRTLFGGTASPDCTLNINWSA